MLSVVFCMTFYNLQNSVKLPPEKNTGNGISRMLLGNILKSRVAWTRLDASPAFVAPFVAPQFSHPGATTGSNNNNNNNDNDNTKQ